jgi:hypothetical protein
MKHRALMSTLLVAFVIGCGGKPAPKSPAGEAGSGQPEASAPTEPTIGGTEPSPVDTSTPKDSAGPASASAPAAAADKPCKKLKKGLCKVTRGCAWRDGPGAGCIEATEASESSAGTDE